MNKLDVIEQSRLRKDIPPFRPGDQVKVHVKVTEGTRERIQVFEGVVLGRRGGGLRESFTVRKISFGVGVERTFPIHGPSIDKVEIVRHGRVRRAKLYYLRERIGRSAKIDERRTRIKEWSPESAAAEAEAAEAAAEAEDAAAPDGAATDETAPEAAAPEVAEAATASEPAAEAEPTADAPAEEPAAASDEAAQAAAAPEAAAADAPAEPADAGDDDAAKS